METSNLVVGSATIVGGILIIIFRNALNRLMVRDFKKDLKMSDEAARANSKPVFYVAVGLFAIGLGLWILTNGFN